MGHAVVLRLLQRFVDDGHDVILLIGDFTARIGDPSGRNALRPPLTDEQIETNMRTYAAQAGKVLDMSRVRTVFYNSEWLSKLTFSEIYKLLSQTTVAQMLERNDFKQRYESGTPIALHEFVYPVAVAYDSVALNVDVELGGSDQLFNLLISRPYQVHAGQDRRSASPSRCSRDRRRKKMSKSPGNHIGLTDAPNDMFGKTMRIPDELLPRYARLAAWWPAERVRELEAGIRNGRISPMDEKKRIAEDIVALYHGRDAARAARDWFERTIQRGEIPAEMPEMALAGRNKLADLIVAAGFAESKRAAQRLIAEAA